MERSLLTAGMRLPPVRSVSSPLRRTAALLALLAGAGAPLVAQSPPPGLPVAASPEAEGFSGPRLARIPDLLGRLVDTHQYAGAVWLVARDGKIVSQGAVGYSDIEAKKPMSASTEFAMITDGAQTWPKRSLGRV